MKRQGIIMAICTGAVCLMIGFGAGAVLTMPNHSKYTKTIADLKMQVGQAKTQTDNKDGIIGKLAGDLKHSKKQLAAIQPNYNNIRSAKPPTAQKKTNNHIISSDQVISQLFFGIRLGESIYSLKSRCQITPENNSISDDGSRIWLVRTANPDISRLGVTIYSGQVAGIVIDFKDASDSNYEAIKKGLLNKYGSNISNLSDDIFNKLMLAPKIDGIQMGINLTRDENVFDHSQDTLMLIYLHTPLCQKINNENQKHKLSKVKDQF